MKLKEIKEAIVILLSKRFWIGFIDFYENKVINKLEEINNNLKK